MTAIDLDVDVGRTRVRINGPIELIPDVERILFLIDGVRLDTGCAHHLIGPLDAVPPEIGRTSAPSHEQVHGFGGVTATWVFNATLQMPDGTEYPVVVKLVEDSDGWYLGLPILAEYDLLLRPDRTGSSKMTR